MKKYFFLFAALGLLVLAAKQSQANVQGNGIPTTPVDYAGVEYSTNVISGSTNPVIVFNGPGSVSGFVASSNTAITDFVAFYDTAAVAVNSDIAATTEVFRVYLSSTPPNPYYNLGSTWELKRPVRFRYGVAARCSVSNVTNIRVLGTEFNK